MYEFDFEFDESEESPSTEKVDAEKCVDRHMEEIKSLISPHKKYKKLNKKGKKKHKSKKNKKIKKLQSMYEGLERDVISLKNDVRKLKKSAYNNKLRELVNCESNSSRKILADELSKMEV